MSNMNAGSRMRPIVSSNIDDVFIESRDINHNITLNMNENLNQKTNANQNIKSEKDINNNDNGNINANQKLKDMSRNSDMMFHSHGDYFPGGGSNNVNEESLDINLIQNLNNLTNMTSKLTLFQDQIDPENNENMAFFTDNFDDPKEGNISRNVRVPSSEHVAEIVGRQGCKIKDLRARTNTYIKTPMRTQSPVFVVTGKEEAVQQVMQEINNAAEHFTHIRASRNHHKTAGGLETAKPVSREGDIMMYVTVPYRVVGLVVGLKGQTIKTIQQETDTFIVTPNRDRAPVFEIRGQPENVEKARSMILTHIEHRTRHCSNRQLQDATNLYENGELTPGEISPPQTTLSGSSCNAFDTSTLRSRYSNGSSPTSNSYNGWRSYTNNALQDHQMTPMTAWSSATSDFNPPSGSNLSDIGPNINAYTQYQAPAVSPSPPFNGCLTGRNILTSTGSSVSPTSSKGSGSPPPDYLAEITNNLQDLTNLSIGSFSGLINNPMNSYMKTLSPTESPFSGFPLLTSPQSTTTKGNTLLGNLIPQNKNTFGMMSSSRIDPFGGSGFSGPTSDELMQQSTRRVAENSVFPSPLNVEMNVNGILEEESSKSTSKSSDSSASSGSGSNCSPEPRVCKVCDDAEIVAALVSCGHNLFCMECAEGIINNAEESDRKCPTCNMPATGVLRIRA